jgi:nitroreductase
MTDAGPAVTRLRAVRSFRPEPLSEDNLRAVLEAGRWTGSSKNLQLWAFIVVADPEQKERLAACGNFMDPVRNAPTAIAIVEEPGGYEFDSGRVAQNMMLAAAGIEVATCPVTIHNDAAAHAVLGLSPGQRCRYAIAIGYPEQGLRPPARKGGGRKPLDELVHRDRYSG